MAARVEILSISFHSHFDDIAVPTGAIRSVAG
jgi:hypothetical protein